MKIMEFWLPSGNLNVTLNYTPSGCAISQIWFPVPFQNANFHFNNFWKSTLRGSLTNFFI